MVLAEIIVMAFQQIVGEWIYQSGNYSIFYKGECFIFREKDIEGPLHQNGDWLEASVKHGIIRLQLQADGTLKSQCRKEAEATWGGVTIARRKEVVSAVINELCDIGEVSARRCPKRHTLKLSLYQAPCGGSPVRTKSELSLSSLACDDVCTICDLCRKRIQASDKRHRCQICDYDLCSRCYEFEGGKTLERSASRGPDGKILDVGSDSDFGVVLDLLLVGNVLVAEKRDQIKRLGIQAVVRLVECDDDSCPFQDELEYLYSPIEDKPQTGLQSLVNGVPWAEGAAQFVEEQIAKGNKTYIHCSQGISRAASLTMYYLMTRRNMNLRQAYDHVKACRSKICPSIGFMSALAEKDKSLHDGISSFSVDAYRLSCLKEVFPKLSDEVIRDALSRAGARLQDDNEVQGVEKRAGSENIEPLGYLAIDIMTEEHGGFVRRRGCSRYHPFD